MDRNGKKRIALEARLKTCKNVITLGVKTNLSDYGPDAVEMIRSADKIYYPTTFYADLFDASGKATFPSYHTYKCVQDKIKQTALFGLLDIPHPRTRTFYGRRKASAIPDYFDFPFIAKVPKGSAMGRGVYLIRDQADLDEYCAANKVGYIQEYLESDRDIRVVVIGNEVVLAYWRIAREGEFRSNVASGAVVSLDDVPEAAVRLAAHTASVCRWDDVGIDILPYKGGYYVLEANMKYGKEGFRKAGVDYMRMMERLIEDGRI